MFWSRPPVNPGPIILLEPAEGAVTEPLQRFQLESDEEFESYIEAEARGEAPPRNSWWDPKAVSPDRSIPNVVTFRWLPPPRLRRSHAFDLVVDRDPAFPSPMVIRDIDEPAVRVRHLHVDTVYYWQVFATCRGEVVSQSPVSWFRTHEALPRWIHVPEITNVRDLGGWPAQDSMRVRQGLVYRSSEMNTHLSLNAEGVHVMMRELGIRTDIDLRSSDEAPAPALPSEWVRWLHLPIEPYQRIFDPDLAPTVREIFRVLAQPGAYPLVIHCWAGADRAGTISFLLNGLLGVRFGDLALDYEMSSLSIWGERSRRGDDFLGLCERLLGSDLPQPDDIIAEPVAKLLQQAGVTAGEIAAIRAHLLEPRSQ